MATKRPTKQPTKPLKTRGVQATEKTRNRDEDLQSFAERMMLKYGFYVIENRALPDLFDGLKPVQRRILYSASQVPAGQYVKTARIVGDTIGRYHPHGDTSVADAIPVMVHMTTPPIDGKGNWGNLIDSAAAMRYTNCRLSKFGRTFFDPNYTDESVTPYVPNYDDKEKEPYILPAQLPNILLNGPRTGIAYGVATVMPTFTVDSVCDILIRLLRGDKLKVTDFAGTLKPAFRWGGEIVRTPANKANWLKLFTGSRARVEYQGKIKIDAIKKQIVLDEWPPGINPEDVILKLRGGVKGKREIKGMPEVAKVWNSKGSLTFTVSTKPGYNAAQFELFCKKVQKLMTSALSYNMNMTRRSVEVDGLVVTPKTELLSLSVPQIVMEWLKLRLELEIRSLNYRIKKQNEAIAHTNLIIYATSILDVIRKAWDAPNFVAYVTKHGKLTVEQAKVLAQFRLIQLSKLDQAEWRDKLKKQQAHLKQLQGWLAKPKAKMLGDIEAIAATLKAAR